MPQRHEKAPQQVHKIVRVVFPLPQYDLSTSRDAVKEQFFVGLHIDIVALIIVATTTTATIAATVEYAMTILHTAKFNDGAQEQKVLVTTFTELFQRGVGYSVRIARGGSVQIAHRNT
jgi:hypothetical protein